MDDEDDVAVIGCDSKLVDLDAEWVDGCELFWGSWEDTRDGSEAKAGSFFALAGRE